MRSAAFVAPARWLHVAPLLRSCAPRRSFSRTTVVGVAAPSGVDERTGAGTIRRSPYSLVAFMQSRYLAHLNELHTRGVGGLELDPTSELEQALMETGNAHEQRVLSRLQKLGLDCVSVRDRRNSGRMETMQHIGANREVIHQAVFQDDVFNGIADFLLLSPEGVDWHRIIAGDEDAINLLKSHRGDGNRHRYAVMEVKMSSASKSEYLMQVLCYADLLEGRTSRCADDVHFWLGNSTEPLSVKRSSYQHFFRSVRDEFASFLDGFDVSAPVPAPDRAHSLLKPWSAVARRELEASDGLELVAGIRRAQIAQLKRLGISTLTALAEVDARTLRRRTLRRLRDQARLQKKTQSARLLDKTAKPAFKVIDHAGRPLGLASLPPRSNLDVFFDMEGFPLFALDNDYGLEYLFGFVDNGRKFSAVWAHDHAAEADALGAFLAEVHRRWHEDPSMHVYHYGAYEISALRRVSTRLGGDAEILFNELLEGGAFVDILRVVRQGILLGEESYSLKKVEKLYGVSRADDELADAESSVGMYHRVRSCTDPAERDRLLQTIADYNEQDCVSLADLTDWLRGLQRRKKISHVPEPEPEVDAEGVGENELELLRVSGSCGRGPAQKVRDARVILEAQRLAEKYAGGDHNVLCHLMSFHLREGRPARKRFRDRLVRTDEEEMFADSSCIGSVTIKRQVELVKDSGRSVWVVEGSYDALQPVRLGLESRVAVLSAAGAPSPPVYGLLRELSDGRVGLEFSKLEQPLEDVINVISLGDLGFCPAVMRGSILQTAKSVLGGEQKEQPELCTRMVDKFLRQEKPVLRSGRNFADTVERVVAGHVKHADLIDDMAHSVLIVQGPPGSGKTRLCAEFIADLAARGRRIAVSSNSHPSIENVLAKVAEKGGVKACKVPSLETPVEGVLRASSLSAAAKKGAAVIGATVYQLSRPEAAGMFDVLVVDEAGQVSVANLASMATCARNAVLVGDQRQLEMPLQGVHDLATGNSCLQYALGKDCVTVPRDMGLFLNTSYRMAPSLCRTVSEGVYEGHLCSHNVARDNRVDVCGLDHVVHRGDGVVFVGHVGDDSPPTSSAVEVRTVAKIFKELLGRQFKAGTANGALSEKDILVVAPYNLQAAALRRALGPSVRVGTIDKFQGQEAPVVLLSMCGYEEAEDTSDIKKTASFVLRKNRLNVAISRAQCLAVVVGSAELARAPVRSIDEIELLSLYCRIIEDGSDERGHFTCIDTGNSDALRRDSLNGHLAARRKIM